jgi:hypothetical protein
MMKVLDSQLWALLEQIIIPEDGWGRHVDWVKAMLALELEVPPPGEIVWREGVFEPYDRHLLQQVRKKRDDVRDLVSHEAYAYLDGVFIAKVFSKGYGDEDKRRGIILSPEFPGSDGRLVELTCLDLEDGKRQVAKLVNERRTTYAAKVAPLVGGATMTDDEIVQLLDTEDPGIEHGYDRFIRVLATKLQQRGKPLGDVVWHDFDFGDERGSHGYLDGFYIGTVRDREDEKEGRLQIFLAPQCPLRNGRFSRIRPREVGTLDEGKKCIEDVVWSAKRGHLVDHSDDLDYLLEGRRMMQEALDAGIIKPEKPRAPVVRKPIDRSKYPVFEFELEEVPAIL